MNIRNQIKDAIYQFVDETYQAPGQLAVAEPWFTRLKAEEGPWMRMDGPSGPLRFLGLELTRLTHRGPEVMFTLETGCSVGIIRGTHRVDESFTLEAVRHG